MMKKIIYLLFLLCVACACGGVYWVSQPILAADQKPVEFSINAGSGVFGAAQQMADAGVPVNPVLFALLARGSGEGNRLKAGSYEIKPGTTPLRLLEKLVRGEFAQDSLTIIEGWSFKQMRQAIAAFPGLKHDTASWSDSALLSKLTADFTMPEGLFFPDTYLFARGASDMQVYRQAFALMSKRLTAAWNKREVSLPYKTPYEALIMASIVEKETGKADERSRVAAVFVNRLRQKIKLQSDPTIIYGLVGGKGTLGRPIKRSEILQPSPYNTYVVDGLPPGPIANPGRASLEAAANPARTRDLFFVADGTGGHAFTETYDQHQKNVARLRAMEKQIQNDTVEPPDDPPPAAAPADATPTAATTAKPPAPKRPARSAPARQGAAQSTAAPRVVQQ